MPKFILIKRKPILYGNPPSFDVIEEFENDINRESYNFSFINNNKFLTPKIYKLLVAKMGIPLNKFTPLQRNNECYFSIQMGPDFGKILPYCSRNNNTYAYFFDIWPKFFHEMENFLTHSSITHVFLSSQYTTNYFNNKGYKNVSWIPEGVLVDEYKYLPPSKKNIDILELGRKHQTIHNNIVDILKGNNKIHLYERIPGNPIFPSKEEFLLGMAQSKISICFPKSETHPILAGKIDTMTNRYLQSMASKCLIVGSAPDEMKYLFGYDPVVNLNRENPGEHLLHILNHYNDYIGLIEQNYQNVIKNHSWKTRWKSIIEIIENTNNSFI